MNEQNLRPIKLTHEQAVEYGRKGGIRSGKSRQRKKELKKEFAFMEIASTSDTMLAIKKGLTKRELFFRYLKRYEPKVYDAIMQIKEEIDNEQSHEKA